MTITERIRAIATEEHCSILNDGTILFRDTIGRTSFTMALEDDFGISDIAEDEAERCSSIADWVELVGRKASA